MLKMPTIPTWALGEGEMNLKRFNHDGYIKQKRHLQERGLDEKQIASLLMDNQFRSEITKSKPHILVPLHEFETPTILTQSNFNRMADDSGDDTDITFDYRRP